MFCIFAKKKIQQENEKKFANDYKRIQAFTNGLAVINKLGVIY